MKKIITFFLCLIISIFPYVDTFADESLNKLIINSINIKDNRIRTYFDTVDSGETYNDKDINKNDITATLEGENLTVSSIDRFEKTNEGIAYLFMVDISKSMGKNGLNNIKKLFTDMANKMGDKDKLAIVTFGSSEKVVQDFTADKTAFMDKVNTINTNEDNTDLYRAVTKGIDMLSNNPNIPVKRAIVIISDGEESNDQGITKDEVLMKISQSNIPIFSVALKSTNDNSIKESTKILGSFARLSNGQDFELGDGSKTTTDIIQSIITRINSGYVVNFDCSNVKMDGQSANFNLNIQLNENTFINVSKTIILPIASDAVNESAPSVPFYRNYYLVSGTALILIVIFVFIFIFRKKKKVMTLNESDGINDIVFLSEGDENLNMDKTMCMDANSVSDNSICKTFDSQQYQQNFKKGIKVRLFKIGKNDEKLPYEFTLTDSIVIGRNPSKAELVFKNDELLSGRHCQLLLREGKISICDLNSSNGTYVNGVPISGSFRLHKDDVILIGSMELRIIFDEKN